MNWKQLVLMWVGIIVLVLMGLFPPWIAKGKKRGHSTFLLF